MGKMCVVKSCPSGRKRKTLKNHDPQFLSFFQPRTPTRLENWRKSLGIELKATDNVCHLHFKEDHIKMYEKMTINGELKLFPMGRKMLTEEAIPTIKHQFISVPVQQKHKLCIIDVQQEQNLHNHSSKEQQQYVQYNSNNSTDNIDECPQKDFQKPFPIQQIENNKEDHQEKYSLSFDYILNNIRNYFILPQFWFYAVKSKKIEFMRIDHPSRQIKNHIRLNEDLTTTVIFSNNEELLLEEKIESFQNIYEFLKSIEKWPVCVGTQIKKNNYSKLCKGVLIGDDAYRRTQENPRCKFCRTLRHRLQKRSNKNDVLKT